MILRSLCSTVEKVFVRKERQRRRGKLVRVKKIKRASFTGTSRRPCRHGRNERFSFLTTDENAPLRHYLTFPTNENVFCSSTRACHFSFRACCTGFYTYTLTFLDVCTAKSLYYLQGELMVTHFNKIFESRVGCPAMEYPGSLMENGLSSSDEEVTHELFLSPKVRKARQRF